jgi:hypothetical protein
MAYHKSHLPMTLPSTTELPQCHHHLYPKHVSLQWPLSALQVQINSQESYQCLPPWAPLDCQNAKCCTPKDITKGSLTLDFEGDNPPWTQALTESARLPGYQSQPWVPLEIKLNTTTKYMHDFWMGNEYGYSLDLKSCLPPALGQVPQILEGLKDQPFSYTKTTTYVTDLFSTAVIFVRAGYWQLEQYLPVIPRCGRHQHTNHQEILKKTWHKINSLTRTAPMLYHVLIPNQMDLSYTNQ